MSSNLSDYSTNIINGFKYKSFNPKPLPTKIKLDTEMTKLLIEADKKLITFDLKAQLIPNIEQFICMQIRKEALISSQIEGKKATLEDLFDLSNDLNPKEVLDVSNCLKAIEYSAEQLKSNRITLNLLKDTHKILLNSKRDQAKNTGNFRTKQNYIGNSAADILGISFTPPNVKDMQDALNELEKYINEEHDLDPLIKAALIHYQFEIIHPFDDSNGRIGRILILLYLLQKQVIHSPALYISYYLKQHRNEYYQKLNLSREAGNYEQWIKFFLQAII